MFTKKAVTSEEEDAMDALKKRSQHQHQPSAPEGSGKSPAMTNPTVEKPKAPMPRAGAANRLGGKAVSASIISADLTIVGNLKAAGEVQIEGTIEGDINAHHVNVGETATIRGEIVADDIVVYGKIMGRVRGEKVRLSSTAQVEGDIIHRNIAIESGAHFEGSVQRSESPLGGDRERSEDKPEDKNDS